MVGPSQARRGSHAGWQPARTFVRGAMRYQNWRATSCRVGAPAAALAPCTQPLCHLLWQQGSRHRHAAAQRLPGGLLLPGQPQSYCATLQRWEAVRNVWEALAATDAPWIRQASYTLWLP